MDARIISHMTRRAKILNDGGHSGLEASNKCTMGRHKSHIMAHFESQSLTCLPYPGCGPSPHIKGRPDVQEVRAVT